MGILYLEMLAIGCPRISTMPSTMAAEPEKFVATKAQGTTSLILASELPTHNSEIMCRDSEVRKLLTVNRIQNRMEDNS